MTTKARLPWSWLVFGVAVLVLFSVPTIRGWFGKGVQIALHPVVLLGQRVVDRWPSFGSRGTEARQRQELQRQVEELTIKVYETNLQLETIQAAVKLTDYSTASKHQLTMASVIAASPDPGIQSVVIDRGSNDRIAIGQVVVAERGTVIGKVVTVHQTQSTVLLLTDRQSVLAVRVQNQNQSPGIVRGERGLALQMGFIPKNDTVKNGDTVVTSGTETLIPADILIGSITSTSSRPGDLFQQAIVTPAAALTRLRIVGVIRQ